MKVVSTQVAFINGNRVRPGVPFEIPDGSKLGAGMSRVDEDGKAAGKAGGQGSKKAGDTKPADAAAAAAAKQNAGQDGGNADTKPADAQKAAAGKAGGQG